MKYLKNIEDSKDMVMDLYEKVLSDLKKHEVDNFRSWIYVTTRNQCLLKLRKEKRQPTMNDEYILSNVVDSSTLWHPDNCDVDEFRLNNLDICIEKLSIEQRNCVNQFYFKKKSYNKIAALFDLDIKKVKSNIQNGKRNLKNCIDQIAENTE